MKRASVTRTKQTAVPSPLDVKAPTAFPYLFGRARVVLIGRNPTHRQILETLAATKKTNKAALIWALIEAGWKKGRPAAEVIVDGAPGSVATGEQQGFDLGPCSLLASNIKDRGE